MNTAKQAHDDLCAYCKSDVSLSLEGLKQKLDGFSQHDKEKIIHVYDDDEDVWTPLHNVCFNPNVDLEVVKFLCDLQPKAPKMIRRECLPLDNACISNFCSTSVVKFLLSKFPEAIRTPSTGSFIRLPLHHYVGRSEKGPLPLHHYVGRSEKGLDKTSSRFTDTTYHLDMDLLSELVRLSPPSALTNHDNFYDETPLHLACQREDVSLEMIRLLVDDHSFAVLGSRDGYEYKTPLEHLLGSYRNKSSPPLDCVQFLLEHSQGNLTKAFHAACRDCTHPKPELLSLFLRKQPNLSEQRSEDFGQLPLHSICLNETSTFDAIQTIYDAYPDAIRMTCGLGFKPVEYATSKSTDILKYLVGKYPACVHEVDLDGGSLFHSVCRNGNLESIKYILSLNPEAISQEKSCGDTPLRGALNNTAGRLQEIKFLLERSPPEFIKKPDYQGKLPLHCACLSFKTPKSLLEELFEIYPEAIHTRDSKGRLPIHCVLDKERKDFDEASFRFLAKQLPYGKMAKDSEGKLPIHYLCERRMIRTFELTIGKFKSLVKSFPRESIKVESPIHGLPIHCACTSRADAEVINFLISLFPESLNRHNESIGLPLHCATRKDLFMLLLCQRYKHLHKDVNLRSNFLVLHTILWDKDLKEKGKVIQTVLDLFGGPGEEEGPRGTSPLHLAVNDDVGIFTIRRLLERNPKAIKKQDSSGKLPLHHAIAYGSSFEIIQLLIQRYPESCHIKDKQNVLPIHYACRHDAEEGVIRKLLTNYPDGATCKDKNGLIPMHVACRHNLRLTSLQVLIREAPDTLQSLCKDGELPLHKACRGGHANIIKVLLPLHMVSAGVYNSSGKLPLFLLCQESGKRNIDIDSPQFVEAAWALLRAYPAAVKHE